MKKGLYISIVTTLVAVGILACSDGQRGKEQALTGSDRDAHGCIISAGYRWCEKTKKCERPWELADKEKFENSAKAFHDFCNKR